MAGISTITPDEAVNLTPPAGVLSYMNETKADVMIRRSRRLTPGVVLALLFALGWAGLFGGGYLAQRGWVNRPGTILEKSCHMSDGGPDVGTFKACHLVVSYPSAHGGTRTKTLDGVTPDKIHAVRGHETVDLYFAGTHSDVANNPQNRMPLFAVVIIVAIFSGAAVWIANYLSRRAGAKAEAKANATAPSPPLPTAGAWQ